jgi:hypothetical protein
MVLDSSQIAIITASGQTTSMQTLDYGTMGMQVTGIWTGTLVPEVTLDGVNWVGISIAPVPAGTVVSSITAVGIFQANVSGVKSFRLRASTAITGSATVSLQASATTAAISELLAGGGSSGTTTVSQPTASLLNTTAVQPTASLLNTTAAQPTASLLNATIVGTAAAGAAASGNPVQIGGVYNSTAPTPSSGQVEPLQLDSNSNLQSTLYTAIAGESLTYNRMQVAPVYNYTNFTTANTGVALKASQAILHTVTINFPVASGTVAIYDSPTTNTTPIFLITLPATLIEGPMTMTYDVAAVNGMWFVSTGTNINVTVSWL